MEMALFSQLLLSYVLKTIHVRFPTPNRSVLGGVGLCTAPVLKNSLFKGGMETGGEGALVYDAQILVTSQHPAGIGPEVNGRMSKRVGRVLGARGGLPDGLTCRLVSFTVRGERESRGPCPVPLARRGGGQCAGKQRGLECRPEVRLGHELAGSHWALPERELAESQGLSCSEVHVAVFCGADDPPAASMTPNMLPAVWPQAASEIHTLPALSPRHPVLPEGLRSDSRSLHCGGATGRQEAVLPQGLCLSPECVAGIRRKERGNRSWFGQELPGDGIWWFPSIKLVFF